MLTTLLPDEEGVCLSMAAGELAMLLQGLRRVEPRPSRPPTAARKRRGGKSCRHCTDGFVNRPRGLCWTCYYTPDVRKQYPSTSKYVSRGIGAGNIQGALAAQPTTALPGSPEKVAVLEERARLGLSLFHPLDAPMDAESRALGLSCT